MKTILLLILILPSLVMARVVTQRIDTSVVSLTSSFADSSGPLTVINNGALKSLDSMMIDNNAAGEIVVNCSTALGHVPSDTSLANVYIQAKEAWVMPDDAGFTTYCYIRSYSGTISSGVIVVTAVGR